MFSGQTFGFTNDPPTRGLSLGFIRNNVAAFVEALEAAMRLTAKERFALLEQFATLVDSGIQIAAALQAMRQQASQPRIGAVLAVLEDAVVGGQSLSQSMQAMPKAFPPMLAQMVRAGETTGALGDMLRRTVEVLEMEATLRSKLRSAMLYPCVMVVLTVSVVTFLLAFIVPKFERMFRGKQLPTPTRLLMALGDAASTYGVWALLGLVVLAGAAFLFARTTRGLRFFDRFLLRIPVVGSMYRTAGKRAPGGHALAALARRSRQLDRERDQVRAHGTALGAGQFPLRR